MIKIGDKLQFWGHSVSCEHERERYMKGLCPVSNDQRHLKVGNVYTVVKISNYRKETAEFGDIQGVGVNGDNITVHGCSFSNFIKINNNNMKITNLVKKILDKDTRTLVSAGFINGDLALTDDGVSELLGILFLQNKDELVKIATEKIEEKQS